MKTTNRKKGEAGRYYKMGKSVERSLAKIAH